MNSNDYKQTPAECAAATAVALVELQQHYGNTTAYPLNRTAGLLAELAGTRTLTRQTIQLAAALGFSFEVRHLTGALGNTTTTTAIPAADLADHVTN